MVWMQVENVYSLYGNLHPLFAIIVPKGWLQNLNLSLLQNALSGTACAQIRQSIYSSYCVITSGHFNGVFSLHATEDISGIDFWWWTKEIVCSLPLSMIKRLARWINRVSTCYFFLLVDSTNETDLPAQVCIHPTVQWLCQYPGTSSSLILSLSVTSSWI